VVGDISPVLVLIILSVTFDEFERSSLILENRVVARNNVESQRAITFQNTLVPRPLSSPLGCMPCRHSDRQFHYMFWCSAISPQPPRGRGEFGVSPLTSLLHAFFQSHLLCVSMWGCGDVGVCVSARESTRARYTVARRQKNVY